MRVRVTGDNDVAKALRGNLRHEGFVVDGGRALYTIDVDIRTAPLCCAICQAHVPVIVVDGVDSEFERHIVNGIASLKGGAMILLHRGGANVDDRRVTISVPHGDENAADAIEIGVLRGLINATRPRRPRRWWSW